MNSEPPPVGKSVKTIYLNFANGLMKTGHLGGTVQAYSPIYLRNTIMIIRSLYGKLSSNVKKPSWSYKLDNDYIIFYKIDIEVRAVDDVPKWQHGSHMIIFQTSSSMMTLILVLQVDYTIWNWTMQNRLKNENWSDKNVRTFEGYKFRQPAFTRFNKVGHYVVKSLCLSDELSSFTA